MVGLVLANLVFVQLTEAASPAWIAPLYILTLLSSFFARFKENATYRAFWNLGVLGFFAVLVRHAMSADLTYVLQDGLLLAALCQVHLLNNLHRDQRPDLLFLNSYLIAVITGYITVDLGFAGAFLVYVPFFVLGLQYLSVYRAGARLSGKEARAIAFDGAKRTFVLLGLALLVFAFWPRDFQREALLTKYFELNPDDSSAKVDFSESLDLQKRRKGGVDEGRLVMTIAASKASVQAVPPLWRGTTLGRLLRDGSWAKLEGADHSAPTGDSPWLKGESQGRVQRSAVEGAPLSYLQVVRKGGPTNIAFMPYGTVEVELARAHSQGHLEWDADGTVAYSNPGELRYRLALGEPAPLDNGSLQDFAPFVDFERTLDTRAATELAEKLRDRLAEDASDGAVAESFSSYLRERCPYFLPGEGEEDAAGTLHEFLTTKKGGHCEFFASALATMLRSESIPARIATGFRVGDPDPDTGTWSVRSTAAHVWVEAAIDGRWRTFDPTPAAGPRDQAESLIDRANAALLAMWKKITSFDAGSRTLLTDWLKEAPGRFMVVCLAHPRTTAGSGGLVLLLIIQIVRRRRARTPSTVRALRTAFRFAEIRPEPGETPRETLERVESLFAITADDLDGLREAVMAHEVSRYRGDKPPPHRGA